MFQKIYRFQKYLKITSPFWYLRRKWRIIMISINSFLLRRTGVEVGKNVVLLGMPIIHLFDNSKIIIGKNCHLVSSNEHSTLGINHPIFIRTVRSGARITIGDDTGISGGTFVASSSITIGKNVLIGPNVSIVDSDFHTIKAENRRYSQDNDEIQTAPVIIEDNVFIGADSIILKGVTVGSGSIIGAGSVVVHNVPSNTIVGGNPAKFIREITI